VWAAGGLFFLVRGIQDGIWNLETSYRLAVDDVRFDYFIHVFGADASVPNGFGINDYGWAEFALIEASGFIGADVLDTALGELGFEQALQFALAGGIAAAAQMAGLALIHAYENMFVELWHDISLTHGACRHAKCVKQTGACLGRISLAGALDAGHDADAQ
jgi:hypothetical protein